MGLENKIREYIAELRQAAKVGATFGDGGDYRAGADFTKEQIADELEELLESENVSR